MDEPPGLPAGAYLLLAFVGSDGLLRLAWSTDGGARFREGAPLHLPGGLIGCAPPALASGGGRVFVAYTARDVQAWEMGIASTADGLEWSAPVVLSTSMVPAEALSAGLVAAGGELYAAYPDASDDHRPVLLASGHAGAFEDRTNLLPGAGIEAAIPEGGGLALACSGGTLLGLLPRRAPGEAQGTLAWCHGAVGGPGGGLRVPGDRVRAVATGPAEEARCAGRPAVAIVKGKLYAAFCASTGPRPADHALALLCLADPARAGERAREAWTDVTPALPGAPRAPSLATDGATLFLAFRDAGGRLALYATGTPDAPGTWEAVAVAAPPAGPMRYDPALLWVEAPP